MTWKNSLNLCERVYRTDTAVILSGIEIFGHQFGGSRLSGGGEDHGIPNRLTVMGLLTFQRCSAQSTAALKALQRLRGGGGTFLLFEDVLQSVHYELLDGGSSLHRLNFRSLEQVVG